jgi:hypothetical protein
MVKSSKTVAGLFKTVAALLAARTSYHLTRRPGCPKPHSAGPSRSQAGPLDPLACFIQELEDISSMNGSDVSSAVNDLLLPLEEDVSDISVQAVVEVSVYIIHDMHDIYYMI